MNAVMIAATWGSQGMRAGPGLTPTTMVRGCACATAATSSATHTAEDGQMGRKRGVMSVCAYTTREMARKKQWKTKRGEGKAESKMGTREVKA